MIALAFDRPPAMPNVGLIPSHTGIVSLDADWPLEFGGRLHDAVVGFQRVGAALGSRPVVVALGGISASRHVTACADDDSPGWWQPMVGDGLPIDTNAFDVLSIDWVGGAGASTGPRDERPFPSISTHDQARAVVAVLDHLGIARAHAVVGSSYGAMVALALAERHGDRVERTVAISGAHATHPMATALRSVQRDIVRLGLDTGHQHDAVRLARSLAMTTYRTATEFAERFDVAPRWTDDGPRFPVEDYLAHHGERFADTFSPRSFLCLSASVDLHHVDPSAITTPTTLVGVDGDPLVPAWQMRTLAGSLGSHASLHIVSSLYGHDAFLKEVELIGSIITMAIQDSAQS